MRKILLFLLLIPTVLLSQESVVERSGLKPKWVDALEKDYIIVVGTGETIDVARQKALMMIKESIVEAVAVNVKTQSNLRTEEVTNRSSVLHFLESFTSNTTSESAKVPFLQGISLSQAEGFYWEKIEKRGSVTYAFGRGNTTYYYAYHIRYPLPIVDINRLAFEFKLRDEELTAKLRSLTSDDFFPASVEEIETVIGELRILADYFIDGRKDMANMAIRRYTDMLGSITIADAGSTLGTVRYLLKLGNRGITTVKKPILRSESATILNSSQQGGIYTINYDYSECYPDLKNSVIVRYRFGTNSVEKSFYFDVLLTKVDIYMSRAIGFHKVQTGQDNIERYNANIVISSKTAAPFTVTKVILEFKGLPQVVAENLNMSFSGKGDHSLDLQFETPLSAKESSSLGKTVVQLNGYINYINNSTGETGTYRIYNHSYNTDW